MPNILSDNEEYLDKQGGASASRSSKKKQMTNVIASGWGQDNSKQKIFNKA
ncbi:hypothetical protein J4402_00480 [Candidatus Pacearchaeota archaeon]|nr:hypothetical protein [Candidatus Pacearchaeota archaeon]